VGRRSCGFWQRFRAAVLLGGQAFMLHCTIETCDAAVMPAALKSIIIAMQRGRKWHFSTRILCSPRRNCCNTMNKFDDFGIMIIVAMHIRGLS
jgi:hypothetical protein